MQIAYPYKSVTPDGYTHDPKHDACDVETMDCVEPVDEWVDECGVCGGSGYVKSYTSKYLATCLQCHGMGYVRVATQRLQPNGTSLYGQNKLIRGPNRSGEGAAP
jgi:DnaJ-class molecular chaperone